MPRQPYDNITTPKSRPWSTFALQAYKIRYLHFISKFLVINVQAILTMCDIVWRNGEGRACWITTLFHMKALKHLKAFSWAGSYMIIQHCKAFNSLHPKICNCTLLVVLLCNLATAKIPVEMPSVFPTLKDANRHPAKSNLQLLCQNFVALHISAPFQASLRRVSVLCSTLVPLGLLVLWSPKCDELRNWTNEWILWCRRRTEDLGTKWQKICAGKTWVFVCFVYYICNIKIYIYIYRLYYSR